MKTGIIFDLRFCDAMRETKEMFSARILPLVKQLIKAEAKSLKCSEAEILERWAFQIARSPESRQLLLAHATADPMTNAMADVLREDSPPYRVKRKAG